MPGGRSLAAWLVMATLLASYVWLPVAPAFGQSTIGPTPVAVGSVGARVPTPGAARALRSALSDELGELGGVEISPRARARFVVQGAVTRLERRADGQGVLVDCEVSLLVSDARGGAVRMLLTGRAGARGATEDQVVEQAALSAAVRGALRPLPRSLAGLAR